MRKSETKTKITCSDD